MFLSSTKGRKGFTLIELLIVVAIIAILAAIAVPNFLEAQTRSKVARMKADMRSLATAIESYLVDNNSYPASGYRGSNQTWGAKDDTDDDYLTNAGLLALSTPITFISKIPLDIFSKSTGNHGWGSGGPGSCPPQFFTGVDLLSDSNTITQLTERPRRFWVLISYGPDAMASSKNAAGTDTDNSIFDLPVDEENPWKSEHAYFVGRPSDDEWEGIPYDTTNGSLSDGDLFHWASGAVQPGFLK